jgi:hypothetical protein
MKRDSKTFNLDLAKISIIISNLIPIIGIVYFDWKILNILLYFFIESIVIGFYLLVKVLLNNYYQIYSENKEIKNIKESIVYRLFIRDKKVYGYKKIIIVSNIFEIVIVSFFYYLYLYLHFIIIEFIISEIYYINLSNDIKGFWIFIQDYSSTSQIIIPFIVLLISHGISLKMKYIKNQEYKSKNTMDFIELMVYRSLILQGIIILGAFITIIYKSNIVILVITIFTKTIVDLYTHTKEHDISNRLA